MNYPDRLSHSKHYSSIEIHEVNSLFKHTSIKKVFAFMSTSCSSPSSNMAPASATPTTDPAHQATPPLNCASDEGVAYRAAAAAAAMASWTNNCSQNNYNQQHLEDHAPPHVQEGGVANDAHAHANYRTWYAVPPSAGSPVSQVDPYHHSTTPPSTNSTTPTSFNTPPTSRENYGSNSSAAAAAAAAAAVYRSSMFHYNQDCSNTEIKY